ncbi:MAG: hypothetical protein KJ050_02730 [Candidatus Omnitrophica bacterium]|nr:hypothetical protein [Candidatus Omnitrophota bacterium]
MSGSAVNFKWPVRTQWRSMTLTEALLAVFTVGLLLGLWLGGISGHREIGALHNLERRLERLEFQRTLYQPPFISNPDYSPESDRNDGLQGDIPGMRSGVRV